MNKRDILKKLVRSSGLGPKLNQRVSIFEHKATKRNRTRGTQRRRAIEEFGGADENR
jgi:hypothetical protein